jgi:diketogulonate reductase-like aldo/keto reductase
MEALVEKGLTRFIGVSNWTIEMLERMEISGRCKIVPYVNEVGHSVYNQQWAMLRYCETHGIRLTSWSPLVRGSVGPNNVKMHKEAVLVEIGKEVGKTPAQVALKFLAQLSLTVNVIPKSVTPEWIKQNFESFDFELSREQVERIEKLNCGFRLSTGMKWLGYDSLGL